MSHATLISLLDRTARCMVAELVEELARRGYPQIRPAHSRVFEHLDAGGVRLTSLAARAQMTHPAMSELVGDLEALGFVSRTSDPLDGRARLVQLTARGRRLQGLALSLIAEIEDRWLAHFHLDPSLEPAEATRQAFARATSRARSGPSMAPEA